MPSILFVPAATREVMLCRALGSLRNQLRLREGPSLRRGGAAARRYRAAQFASSLRHRHFRRRRDRRARMPDPSRRRRRAFFIREVKKGCVRFIYLSIHVAEGIDRSLGAPSPALPTKGREPERNEGGRWSRNSAADPGQLGGRERWIMGSGQDRKPPSCSLPLAGRAGEGVSQLKRHQPSRPVPPNTTSIFIREVKNSRVRFSVWGGKKGQNDLAVSVSLKPF